MHGMTTDDEFLTVPEVAGRLRVSGATVRRWCADGTLSAVKIGRSYRIESTQLAALVETSRTSTPLVLAVPAGQVIA